MTVKTKVAGQYRLTSSHDGEVHKSLHLVEDSMDHVVYVGTKHMNWKNFWQVRKP